MNKRKDFRKSPDCIPATNFRRHTSENDRASQNCPTQGSSNSLKNRRSSLRQRLLSKIKFDAKEMPFTWGVPVILFGLFLVCLGLFLEVVQWLAELKIGEFLNTIGTTIFTMGFFQIILDLKDWRLYFEKTVSSVFKKQDFLNSLNEEELMEIQINALKAYFKDESIAREGSFFEYYKRNIQRLIEKPYREDVHFSIVVHEYDCDDNSSLTISLIASYRCRKGSNGYIQPNIFWDVHKKDIKDLKSIEIKLQHSEENDLPEIEPLVFSNKSWIEFFSLKESCSKEQKECENCSKICLKDINFSSPIEKIIPYHKSKGDNEEIGVCYPLIEKYKKLDNLQVVVKVKYVVFLEDLRILKLYFLTKNVTFSIHYPTGFEMDFYVFGVFKNLLMITQEDNYYRCHCDSWVLPDSGIVWRLKRKVVG